MPAEGRGKKEKIAVNKRQRTRKKKKVSTVVKGACEVSSGSVILLHFPSIHRVRRDSTADTHSRDLRTHKHIRMH